MKAVKKRKKIQAFDVVNGIIIAILCVLFLLPIWVMFISSFTENMSLQMNGYRIIPKKLSFEGYSYVFSSTSINIWRSIGNSLFVAVLGTVLSVSVSLMTAYVLSKKQLVGYKAINAFFLITMFFGGGMIPLFLVVKSIGLYNSIWALIIPPLFNLYHIILIRSYFVSLPRSMEEAAQIDGANDFQVLVKIYLPLSVPMALTIAFFVFVERWNSWTDALLFLSPQKSNLWPLQFVLKNMLENMEVLGGTVTGVVIPTLTAKSVGVVVAIFPLVLIFPLIQKYFVNGVTIGSVKE